MNSNKLVKLFVCNDLYEENNYEYRRSYHDNFVASDLDYVAHHIGIDVQDKMLYSLGKIAPGYLYTAKAMLHRGIGDKISLIANQKNIFGGLYAEGVEITIVDIDSNSNKLIVKIEGFDTWKEKGKFSLITSVDNFSEVSSEVFELVEGQILAFNGKECINQSVRFLEIISGENV